MPGDLTPSGRKNRGFLGFDSSALSTQDLQVPILAFKRKRKRMKKGMADTCRRIATSFAENWISTHGTSAFGGWRHLDS